MRMLKNKRLNRKMDQPGPIQASPQANASSTSKMFKNIYLEQAKKELWKDHGATGDVKFIVESEKISAHRNILAALSPKYKAQFYDYIFVSDIDDVKVNGVLAKISTILLL